MLESEITHSQICVAFVDPIISTSYLVEKLRAKNFTLIAVYTLTQISEEEKKIRYRPELFDHVIYADNEQSPAEIAVALKKLNCNYVFYGYEASVSLTDQISNVVCPAFSNNMNTSLYRYDKFAMNEVLNQHSISRLNQARIQNDPTLSLQLNQIEKWDFPVFIKPAQGSASIGAKKCNTMQDILDFLQNENPILLHTKDKIEDYIIQEYLSGSEYFVDTVSLSGKHHLSSVQRYEKISFKGRPIYRYVEIINPKSDEWKICSDYVLTVLDAVGLKNGFGHTELFLTKKGPALIEVNPRISGASGFLNKLAEHTLNTCQPNILADRIISNTHDNPHALIHFGKIVFLQNWQPRTINQLNTTLLRTLPSYRDSVMLKQPNAFFDEPQSLLDAIAFVLLVNASKSKLDEDYERLISWEKENKLF